MNVLLSEDQIRDYIRLLNRTYEFPFQWLLRRSQKVHIDHFGRSISIGENYWRLKLGSHYSNELKLSQVSMEQFLAVLFAPHPRWELDAMIAVKSEMQKVRDIMNDSRVD